MRHVGRFNTAPISALVDEEPVVPITGPRTVGSWFTNTNRFRSRQIRSRQNSRKTFVPGASSSRIRRTAGLFQQHPTLWPDK